MDFQWWFLWYRDPSCSILKWCEIERDYFLAFPMHHICINITSNSENLLNFKPDRKSLGKKSDIKLISNQSNKWNQIELSFQTLIQLWRHGAFIMVYAYHISLFAIYRDRSSTDAKRMKFILYTSYMYYLIQWTQNVQVKFIWQMYKIAPFKPRLFVKNSLDKTIYHFTQKVDFIHWKSDNKAAGRYCEAIAIKTSTIMNWI